MKKTNNIKILALAVSLALLICGIIGITVSAQTENASQPSANADASLSIYKKNVSFQNAPQLVFAVAYENLDPTAVTLDVWYGEKSGEATNVTSFGNVTVDGKTYLGFAVEPADPKDIDKLVYVQAKAGEILSDVERYSILEFAWSGIMTSETDEAAADFYNIIDYSASVQKWLTASGKFNGTPVGNYFYVKAEEVALDESGYDSGIFTSPITFTLGEAAEGWSVTTYVNGVKMTEVKESGSEITVSSSTICVPFGDSGDISENVVTPQDVTAAPLDFENISVGNTGNCGADTTYVVGSVLATTNKGVTTTTDKNGNDTKAYYFDTNNGTAEAMRLQAHGNDTKVANLSGANAFVFETDLKIDFADAENSKFKFLLGSSAATIGSHPKTAKSYAYYLLLQLDKTTETIKMLDSGVDGNGNWVSTDIKSGEWFKFRIEYYKIATDEMLAVVFINNELVYVSNRIAASNANGDDAWPVYSDSFKEPKEGATIQGVDSVFIEALSATDATVYLDNTFIRRTTLTAPTFSVDEYTSYYSAN